MRYENLLSIILIIPSPEITHYVFHLAQATVKHLPRYSSHAVNTPITDYSGADLQATRLITYLV